MFSKILCKVQGHKWQGCECGRCGKTRNEHHQFQPIEGKCEQQCSVCKKNENLPHQWDGYKCSRCGIVRGFSDRFLPFLHFGQNKNKKLFATGFCLIIIFSFLGVMSILEKKPIDDPINIMGTSSNHQGISNDGTLYNSSTTTVSKIAEVSDEVTFTSEESCMSTNAFIDYTSAPYIVTSETVAVATSTLDTVNLRTVYVTRTGKKYHDSDNCNGASYTPVTIDEAMRRRLSPCEKCVQ